MMIMEFKHIDQLLEKYWAGESSLEDEQRLREYFSTGPVATRHEAFKPLFELFQSAPAEELSADFDERLLAQLDTESLDTPLRVASKAPRRLWPVYLTRIAAAIVSKFLD